MVARQFLRAHANHVGVAGGSSRPSYQQEPLISLSLLDHGKRPKSSLSTVSQRRKLHQRRTKPRGRCSSGDPSAVPPLEAGVLRSSRCSAGRPALGVRQQPRQGGPHVRHEAGRLLGWRGGRLLQYLVVPAVLQGLRMRPPAHRDCRSPSGDSCQQREQERGGAAHSASSMRVPYEAHLRDDFVVAGSEASRPSVLYNMTNSARADRVV